MRRNNHNGDTAVAEWLHLIGQRIAKEGVFRRTSIIYWSPRSNTYSAAAAEASNNK